MKQYIYVGIGGIIGTLLRYGAVRLLDEGNDDLLAIMIANLLGSFLLGLLFTLVSEKVKWGLTTRLCLGTGLLGGFTTFSTFSIQLVQLFVMKEILVFMIYLVTSVLGSLILAYLGIRIAQKIVKKIEG